jgi:ABC-type multidrug transport system ATPase subunit
MIGKSTTISILCGMIPATSGVVCIGGRDINTQLEWVRKQIGFCPQDNVLIEKLTGRQHLYIFGMMKGMSYSQAKQKANEILKILDLEDRGITQLSYFHIFISFLVRLIHSRSSIKHVALFLK